MMQKFLDGKKKYSAFIITVLATMIPLFITEPEAQKTLLDMVPSVAAAIAGIFYIVTEGRLDSQREKASAADGTGAQVVATTHATEAGPIQSEMQPSPSLASENMAVVPQFDPKAFHEDVLATVQATYKETNPATIFYKARDKGMVTDCQHISQAVDYWNYLVDLIVDARDWVREETEKKAGTCGRSPEYYVFTRDFNSTIRAANALGELARSGIDWKAKLAQFQWKLYNVGALAEQLIPSPGRDVLP